jgi:hypothetical protein
VALRTSKPLSGPEVFINVREDQESHSKLEMRESEEGRKLQQEEAIPLFVKSLCECCCYPFTTELLPTYPEPEASASLT